MEHKTDDVGLVIQAIGGMCTIQTSTGDVLQCRLRGRIKKDGVRVLPGDRVRYTGISTDEGVVEEVLTRHSLLQRPYIANVDQVVIVMALAEPSPNLDLLDRILFAAAAEQLDSVIVWNKADLVEQSVADKQAATYRNAGFHTIITSPVKDIGRQQLLDAFGGHISVLAGASGVGKSSLLNWLFQEERFVTGEVSERLQRGRHTTRSVQLVALDSAGWVADSPGFSVLDLTDFPKESLSDAYPEFLSFSATCRFSGCWHRSEPGCHVRTAVDEGAIDEGRYERYLRILSELEEAEARRY